MNALDRLGKLVFPGSKVKIEPSWFSAHSVMLDKYEKYGYYVSGEVFGEPADPEIGKESGLKYPLKINLCKEWAEMMSGYLYGQYDDVVVTHRVNKNIRGGGVASAEEGRTSAMDEYLLDQWRRNGNDALAMTAAMDCATYGGTVIKTVYDSVDNRVRDEWLAPDIYIPRWHPTDVNRLLEVFLAYEISRDDARDIYNLSQEQWGRLPEVALAWERWTDKTYELMVDDIPIRNSIENPVGHIPFVYVPWNRSGAINFGYYGISPLEDTMGVQDEINERMADIGDGIAYSSHPIRVVRNVTKRDDLPVGPDAIWDLGLGFGNRQPDAFTLDTKTNYGEAMKFLDSIERLGRESTGLPPVAFGQDEGSQRSGTTLLIRFLPLTQQIRRARLYWRTGLEQRARRVLELGARFEKTGFSPSDVKGRMVSVDMAPILPKDVTDKINEWAVRIGAGFGTPEEAYEDLGHPEPKKAAEAVLEYHERVAKSNNIVKGVTPNDGGFSDRGQGGSGGSASKRQGGNRQDGSGAPKGKQ